MMARTSAATLEVAWGRRNVVCVLHWCTLGLLHFVCVQEADLRTTVRASLHLASGYLQLVGERCGRRWKWEKGEAKVFVLLLLLARLPWWVSSAKGHSSCQPVFSIQLSGVRLDADRYTRVLRNCRSAIYSIKTLEGTSNATDEKKHCDDLL